MASSHRSAILSPRAKRVGQDAQQRRAEHYRRVDPEVEDGVRVRRWADDELLQDRPQNGSQVVERPTRQCTIGS
jgi:hypothetical protein